MGEKTNISWTDSTWNPVRGCSVVSEGCRNCYAMTMAARFTKAGQAYEGLAYRNSSGAHWTGETRFIEKHLNDPLKWKEPRRVFVNSMSDLFHESIPDVWVDKVFAVTALAPRHIFQILTKHPERMLAYFSDDSLEDRITELWQGDDPDRQTWNIMLPLENVHLGVSAETQTEFDERWDLLRRIPAAVRFLSLEPLLGPIDPQGQMFEDLGEFIWPDWTIIGGESGPKHQGIPDGAGWIENAVKDFRVFSKVFVKQDSGPRPGQQGRIPDEYWLKEFPNAA